MRLEWELSLDRNPVLTLSWIESGGLPVIEPSKPGHGTRYLRSALRGMFGSPPQIIFASEGLRCIAAGPFSPVC